MNLKHATLFACGIAVALATVAEPALARVTKRNPTAVTPTTDTTTAGTPNPASEGYPNGRPWEAVEGDFATVMAKLVVVEGKVDVIDDKVDVIDDKVDVIDDKVDVVDDKVDVVSGKVDEVKGDTEAILERLDGIDAGLAGLGAKLDGIAEDVALLKSTLDVQINVGPDADRDAGSTEIVKLFVHVSQNGAGVPDLTDVDFSFANDFPAGGATYCGAACFTAGGNGVYVITLAPDTTWAEGTYAGSLTVVRMVDDTVSQGSSLVSFDIPAAAP